MYNGYAYYDLRPEVLEVSCSNSLLDAIAKQRSRVTFMLGGQLETPRYVSDTLRVPACVNVSQYYDRAVAALESIKKYCNASTGIAGINDVRSTNSGYIDQTESFFFAEVMKYIYLTFAEPDVIHLDKYVVRSFSLRKHNHFKGVCFQINTEAHPLEAPAELSSYQPPSRAALGGHLPSETWSGAIPQISTVRGVGKKLSDVVQQGL